MPDKPKIIVIAGPTSSGKTALSIKLAKKFNGEIISADSRQVYRGMDIGTGKVTKAEQRQIPHHLLDVSSPRREYNVAHFKRDAQKLIKQINEKNKLPFLVGGTYFWIRTVVDDLALPTVKANKKLRVQLAKKRSTELFHLLKKLDPQRAQTIDRHNPYRLIRAIEIIKATGRAVPILKSNCPYDTLFIGISLPQKTLHKRIDLRLARRFRQGMIAEIKQLHRQSISWRRLYDFGLEYRYVSLFLRGKLTKPEMQAQLRLASRHYAKRQLTWLNKDQRIHWIHNTAQAYHLLRQFVDKTI